MAERYSKIFKYKENTYTEGSPVIISAGALLSDNVTNNVIAQLKFQSVSQKNIKALTVGVMQLDTAERVLGEEIRHQYLDLSVNIGEMFGSKVAIPLTDNSTRCFSARVIEVVFSDNSVWESDNTAIWEKLTLPKCQIDDAELIKQFKIKHGFEYKNHFEKQKDLWFCFCGAVNKDERCHICGSELSKLEEFDIITLKCECDKRLIEEKEERERRQEELRIERAKEREKVDARNKKIKKISMVLTAIVCVIIAFIIVFNNVVIPASNYSKAVALMESGKYTEAISAFKALKEYKDSRDKINECNTAILDEKFNLAIDFIKEEKFIEAYNLLDSLNGYKDSKSKMSSIYEKYKEQKLKTAKRGDYVTFGKFELDDKDYNGSEEIEWLVIDVVGDKALITTKYLVADIGYNIKRDENVWWGNCTLRTWLNNDFFNMAFDEKQKSIICESEILTPYGFSQEGEYTTDKVFLLSILEARKYFPSDESRKCYFMNGNDAGHWWLRSFGGWDAAVYCVYSDGETSSVGGGSYMDGNNFVGWNGVRPAMWIEIK